jgi:hypothetical protein
MWLQMRGRLLLVCLQAHRDTVLFLSGCTLLSCSRAAAQFLFAATKLRGSVHRNQVSEDKLLTANLN